MGDQIMFGGASGGGKVFGYIRSMDEAQGQGESVFSSVELATKIPLRGIHPIPSQSTKDAADALIMGAHSWGLEHTPIKDSITFEPTASNASIGFFQSLLDAHSRARQYYGLPETQPQRTFKEIQNAFSEAAKKRKELDFNQDAAYQPTEPTAEVLTGRRHITKGFTQTKEAQAAQVFDNTQDNLRRTAIRAENSQRLRKEYAFYYPQSIFLTSLDIEGLCKDLGLIHGDVDEFAGEIPAKNLQEIERFTLHKDHAEWFRRLGMDCIADDRIDDMENVVIRTTRMIVCAPANEFTQARQVRERRQFFGAWPDDPLVFAEVPEGWLLVTAWGKESEGLERPEAN